MAKLHLRVIPPKHRLEDRFTEQVSIQVTTRHIKNWPHWTALTLTNVRSYKPPTELITCSNQRASAVPSAAITTFFLGPDAIQVASREA